MLLFTTYDNNPLLDILDIDTLYVDSDVHTHCNQLQHTFSHTVISEQHYFNSLNEIREALNGLRINDLYMETLNNYFQSIQIHKYEMVINDIQYARYLCDIQVTRWLRYYNPTNITPQYSLPQNVHYISNIPISNARIFYRDRSTPPRIRLHMLELTPIQSILEEDTR
jgi:hypothetical protein